MTDTKTDDTDGPFWSCSCGTVFDAWWKFCGDCGKPRPKPEPPAMSEEERLVSTLPEEFKQAARDYLARARAPLAVEVVPLTASELAEVVDTWEQRHRGEMERDPRWAKMNLACDVVEAQRKKLRPAPKAEPAPSKGPTVEPPAHLCEDCGERLVAEERRHWARPVCDVCLPPGNRAKERPPEPPAPSVETETPALDALKKYPMGDAPVVDWYDAELVRTAYRSDLSRATAAKARECEEWKERAKDADELRLEVQEHKAEIARLIVERDKWKERAEKAERERDEANSALGKCANDWANIRHDTQEAWMKERDRIAAERDEARAKLADVEKAFVQAVENHTKQTDEMRTFLQTEFQPNEWGKGATWNESAIRILRELSAENARLHHELGAHANQEASWKMQLDQLRDDRDQLRAELAALRGEGKGLPAVGEKVHCSTADGAWLKEERVERHIVRDGESAFQASNGAVYTPSEEGGFWHRAPTAPTSVKGKEYRMGEAKICMRCRHRKSSADDGCTSPCDTTGEFVFAHETCEEFERRDSEVEGKE